MSGHDPRLLVFIEFKGHIDMAQQGLAGEPAQLITQLELLQGLFQSQVQRLDWEDWPAPRRSLLQSIRVEMHKQLRLLTTDLMFLKAAKQAETLARRRGEIGDRLTNLRGYCDAIIQIAGETTPTQA